MKPEERMLVEAVRSASGGSEWVDARAVHSRLPAELRPALSQEKVARRLPSLARQRHFEMKDDGISKRYRALARSVVVYGPDATEAGRMIFWQAAHGIDLDLSQLVGTLADRAWIELADRDLRTMRTAIDEALFNAGRR